MDARKKPPACAYCGRLDVSDELARTPFPTPVGQLVEAAHADLPLLGPKLRLRTLWAPRFCTGTSMTVTAICTRGEQSYRRIP